MKETIELIRELMPLLDKAGDGAFTLILLSILKGYFAWVVFLLILGGLILAVFVLINRNIQAEKLKYLDIAERIRHLALLDHGDADWIAEQLKAYNAHEIVRGWRKAKPEK